MSSSKTEQVDLHEFGITVELDGETFHLAAPQRYKDGKWQLDKNAEPQAIEQQLNHINSDEEAVMIVHNDKELPR